MTPPDPPPSPPAPSDWRLAERFGLFQPIYTMLYPQTPEALTSKLKWVLMVRVITATLLLGSAVGLQVRAGGMTPVVGVLDGLIISMYAFSVLCGWLMFRITWLVAFAFFQFVVDTALVTGLIYVTGSAESIFSFLYFFNIIAAAYVLFSPGAFVTATLSSLFYAAVLLGTRFGWIPFFRAPDPLLVERGFFLYNLTVNVLAFYLVAFLSSYLAGQLRRAGVALREEQGHRREMQALKNRIVENIGSGVITVDSEGRITSVNRAAQEILGRSAEQLESNPLHAIVVQARTALGPGSEGLSPGSWECAFSREDGRERILGFKVSPLRKDDGEEIGKILIVDDLTHVRALEENMRREERLATVGRLAAGIAHEIRNPLASISGSVQILQSIVEASGEERRLMDIALRETDRLNELITHFLQYVRPAPIQKMPVELGTLIQETISAVRRDPRITESVHLEADIGHTALAAGDPNQLRQVLWNLILNAVDAVDGRGTVQVRTRDLPPDSPGGAHRVELIIADDGPGLPPEVAPRIFDPFFSTKARGTGLGLATVEKIVQTHDGTVVARNRAPSGAEFIIVLPVATVTPQGEDAAPPPPPEED